MTDKTKEALRLALEALGKVTKEMLALKDELAERGARPTTNVFHQRLWDSSFKAYTDTALPAATAIREALADQCVCGEPDTPGTHRTDGPCLAEHPAIKQDLTPEQPALKFTDKMSIDVPVQFLFQKQSAQQQEPVGYWDGVFSKDGGATLYEVPQESLFGRKYPNIPVFAASPASKPWVGLTDEEAIFLIENELLSRSDLIETIEAKLKEKND